SETVAENLQQAGNWLEAAENYRKAFAAYQRLTPDSSGLPEYQHNVDPFHWHNWGNSLREFGTTMGQLERFEEAEVAFAKAIRIHDKQIVDFPNGRPYWDALFRDYRDKGTMYWIRDRSREADQAYGQALEVGDRMVGRFPLRLGDEFFRFLVTCPDPNRRNAKRVREWAGEASQRSPRSADDWRTLGIAHYRLGDYA